MPKYRYKAIGSGGRSISGTLESATPQRASELLRGQGLWVTELADTASSIWQREISFGGPRVKTEHFTVFCRQLATMYKAGISLVDSVQILSEQAEAKPFRKLLAALAEEMKGGTQFSVAAAAYPTVFTAVFVNMVKAGEVSGNLDGMLERLAVFYEKERHTREKVKSAMIYPAIMSVIMVAVVTFMMIFVIPRYVQTFAAMNIELPLPTRIVIAISHFMIRDWYVVLALFVLPFMLLRWIRASPDGRRRLDTAKLKLPVFGRLWHKQAIARFSRTFGSLFAAAVPMLQGLAIVAEVVGNEAIGTVIGGMRDDIRSGNSMAVKMKESWLFPPMVVQMVATGERSGTLDSMLEKVADFYESDVDMMADRLKSLLEPLMIIVLTGVVGVIVLAVMLPSFRMMQSLS